MMQAAINNYSGTVKILTTKINTVRNGAYYPSFIKSKRKFIYDSYGAKTYLTKTKFKWIETDNVIMLVRITSSLLESIEVQGIYRVFDDTANDERYIIDSKERKVIFDKTIFTYEII